MDRVHSNTYRKAIQTEGSATPEQVSLGYIKKQVEQATGGKPAQHFLYGSCLYFPQWRTLSQINPFCPKVPLVTSCLPKQQKPKWNTISCACQTSKIGSCRERKQMGPGAWRGKEREERQSLNQCFQPVGRDPTVLRYLYYNSRQ